MKIHKGFTLMELLIAIAIVGIIAAVAYPSYLDSIAKSRCTSAQAALSGFAQAMERHYTNNGTYLGAGTTANNTGAPTIFSTTSPIDGTDVFYNLTITSATASAYMLQATGVNAQAAAGNLTLSSTGATTGTCD